MDVSAMMNLLAGASPQGILSGGLNIGIPGGGTAPEALLAAGVKGFSERGYGLRGATDAEIIQAIQGGGAPSGPANREYQLRRGTNVKLPGGGVGPAWGVPGRALLEPVRIG